MPHKAGFVNIIGNPNVGKSTLMNKLVGEKLSIITSKAQTTRHRILGILNGDDFQIVYSDTPGIMKPAYKLQEKMLQFVSAALSDADIILYVTDVVEKQDKNPDFINKIKKVKSPVLVLINKIDLSGQAEVNGLMELWQNALPGAAIYPISALNNYNLDNVFYKILELLPEGPVFYEKDVLTDKSQCFFASEIIREKIFLYYAKEIPYSVQIEIEGFKEHEDIIKIRAIIYVLRDSQKSILIGHKGNALKKTGTSARVDMESFFQKKVFLETFVKVRNDWRDKEQDLKYFGYNS